MRVALVECPRHVCHKLCAAAYHQLGYPVLLAACCMVIIHTAISFRKRPVRCMGGDLMMMH